MADYENLHTDDEMIIRMKEDNCIPKSSTRKKPNQILNQFLRKFLPFYSEKGSLA